MASKPLFPIILRLRARFTLVEFVRVAKNGDTEVYRLQFDYVVRSVGFSANHHDTVVHGLALSNQQRHDEKSFTMSRPSNAYLELYTILENSRTLRCLRTRRGRWRTKRHSLIEVLKHLSMGAGSSWQQCLPGKDSSWSISYWRS